MVNLIFPWENIFSCVLDKLEESKEMQFSGKKVKVNPKNNRVNPRILLVEKKSLCSAKIR